MQGPGKGGALSLVLIAQATAKEALRVYCKLELELGLIQPHMAQKPMQLLELGARALRVRSVSREEAWASAGVQDACVSGCGCEAD